MINYIIYVNGVDKFTVKANSLGEAMYLVMLLSECFDRITHEKK
jgi:hypothetical protein